MRKSLLLILSVLLSGTLSFAQLTGTKAIPGDYSTVAAAIADLNSQSVGAGGVIFEVAGGHAETFSSLTSGLITTTGSAESPIVFQKSGSGVNPVISGAPGTTALTEYIICLQGTDYITFNGINLTDPTGNVEWGYAILKASGTDGAQNVTIKNCRIVMNKSNASTAGIYANNVTPGSPTTQLTVTDINGVNSALKFYGDTIQNAYNGIYVAGYNHAAPYSFYDQNNEIGVEGANVISNFGGGSAANNGIYAIYQNNLRIANNNISGPSAGSGTCSGIQVGTSNNCNLDIFNNAISITYNGTGQFYGIYDNHGNLFTGATVVKIYNNTVSNCTFPNPAKTNCQYIYSNGGGAICSFYNNVVTNNTYGSSTAIATGQLIGIYHNGNQNIDGSLSIHDNQVTNITRVQSTLGIGATYYIYINGGKLLCDMYNNLVDNCIVASNGECFGLRALNSSTGTKTIYNNTVTNLLEAYGKVDGISTSNSTGTTLFNNKVMNISALGTTSAISGINLSTLLSPGGDMYCYNNYVGDLKAPASIYPYAIYGIQGNGSQVQTMGIYNNTVYLNASSTGSNFGTYAIYLTYLPVTIILKNNIAVNTSIANGTGKTAAVGFFDYRYSNYSTLSDNNDFFAGTPGPQNLNFYAGPNQDETLAQFQARMAPGESHSITENPPFIQTGSTPFDLHISTTEPTQVESTGAVISFPNINSDFDNDPRFPNSGYPVNPLFSATAPDMGADEFGGILLDLTPPDISYTPLQNTASFAARTLNATITDLNGVPVSGIGLPRIAWKKFAAGTWIYETAVSLGGDQYSFTFGGNGAVKDTIYYYILAQDGYFLPNIGASPIAGAAGFTVNPPAAATPPTDPNFYVVHSTGVAEITVVQNVVVANGQDTCFNATQSVIIAGSGSGFLVQNGGSATIIAGENINFLPGTTVEAGGYMHGYITQTNDYCGTIAPPIVAVKAGIAENQINPDHSSFRIYPNPVTEACTLEYIGKPVSGSTNVEIFGINGVRVFSETYSNEIYHLLAVEKLAPGVYFAQITTGFVKETVKLIKQ